MDGAKTTLADGTAAAKSIKDAATAFGQKVMAAAQNLLNASTGNLSNAQAQSGIIGDQQTIANDTANMAGLTGDSLAVAQDQLAVDQQTLTWAQRDAVLQQAVASAQGRVAQAAAQAALNNYDALQTIQQATLAAALSNEQNQAAIDAANAPSSSGSAPSSGSGYVEDPTLATNAAAFNAANNVVLPPDWAANGIVPTMPFAAQSGGSTTLLAALNAAALVARVGSSTYPEPEEGAEPEEEGALAASIAAWFCSFESAAARVAC